MSFCYNKLIKYTVKSGGHSIYLLNYHLVWCVKYRRAVLSEEIGDYLKQILVGLVEQAGGQIVAIETDLDHVHIVLKAKPTHQLSKLINNLKAVSARKLFQRYPELKNYLWKGHLWSPSYVVVTVGGAPLEIIKQYVETQRER